MSAEYWLQLASSEYWLHFAQQHWLQIAPWLALFVLTVIPSACLLHRTGLHIALAAFNLIPIVLLWVIAFSKWPSRQLIASPRADGPKVKERTSGNSMPENPKPTPLPDEMITRIADRFGANAGVSATLEAKQPLRFLKPEPPLRRFN